MTAFRNVDFDVDAPLDEWPTEAIETVLDRGSLADWGRLATAIRAFPWGSAARRTEMLAAARQRYGSDIAFSRLVERCRQDVVAADRLRRGNELREMRCSAGLSLRRLADLCGVSAANLSRYENGHASPTTDTLARIHHAIAGVSAGARPRGCVDHVSIQRPDRRSHRLPSAEPSRTGSRKAATAAKPST